MKTAILCFPLVNNEKPQYPIGLYKISFFCRDYYKVIVLDQRIEDVYQEIDSYLKTDEIICLGISVMTGIQILSAIEISKRYHEKIPIVWGGMHPTITPEQTLSNDYIDYVIIGEGEEAFLNLLFFLDGKKIEEEKFLSRNNNRIEVNVLKQFSEIQYIDFRGEKINDAYLISRDGFLRAFNIETSRGCPYSCAFCHNTIYHNRYRYITASLIENIISVLINCYKIDGIIFQEDNLFADKTRIEQILRFLGNMNVGWKGNSRVNYFNSLVDDENFMNTLIASGCSTIQFGLESGSQNVLNRINKRINVEDYIMVNKKLAKYNIKIRYNFMVGFPGETTKDLKMTFQVIEKLRYENKNVLHPFLNVYTPYPGTSLYKMACKHGFLPPSDTEGWATISWNNTEGLPWLDFKTNGYLDRKTKEFYERSGYLQ
jgi:radical SAM superfamily enzyme YgiQ (UPF0313 family)